MKGVKNKFLIVLTVFLIVIGLISIFFFYHNEEKKRIKENIEISQNTEVIDLSVIEKEKKEEILKQAIENQYHFSGVEAEVFESTAELKIKADESLFQIEPLKRGEGEAVSPWKNLNRVRIRGQIIANPKKNFYTLLTENNEKINFLVSTIADQKDKTYSYYATCKEENGSYCRDCLTSFYLRNSVDLDNNIQYKKQEVRKLHNGEMVSIIVKSIVIEETEPPEDYLLVDQETKFFKTVSDPDISDISNKENWQVLEFIGEDGSQENFKDNQYYNAIGLIIYEN